MVSPLTVPASKSIVKQKNMSWYGCQRLAVLGVGGGPPHVLRRHRETPVSTLDGLNIKEEPSLQRVYQGRLRDLRDRLYWWSLPVKQRGGLEVESESLVRCGVGEERGGEAGVI